MKKHNLTSYKYYKEFYEETKRREDSAKIPTTKEISNSLEDFFADSSKFTDGTAYFKHCCNQVSKCDKVISDINHLIENVQDVETISEELVAHLKSARTKRRVYKNVIDIISPNKHSFNVFFKYAKMLGEGQNKNRVPRYRTQMLQGLMGDYVDRGMFLKDIKKPQEVK